MAWYLEIQDESGELDREPVAADCLIIGRSSTAQVRLESPSVSRQHAELRRQKDQWELTDLGSRGGTRVNGIPAKKQIVGHNDEIQISRYTLRLIDTENRTHAFTTSSAWVSGSDAPSIDSLSSAEPPNIELSHISKINAFGRSLLTTEDPDDRLMALCDAVAGDVLRARWAAVIEIHDDLEKQPPQVISVSPDKAYTRSGLHISRTTVSAMLDGGGPVLASNFSEDNQLVEMSIVQNSPETAVAACPLDDSAGITRALYVNLPPTIATTQWLAVISLAAKEYQQAEAIWRERINAQERAAIERDLDNARAIQMSLLPKAIDTQGYDIAWSFVPCDAVGGDLLDILPLDDDSVLITIADVSGHGLPSALATLSIHSVVQTCVKNHMPPEKVTSTLNDYLCEHLPSGRFVTMLFLVIDLKTGKTLCISAGHEPPIVLKADGTLRSLQAAGHLILGVSEIDVESETDQLNPGDALLLYTDGLTELRDREGKMLRTEGLSQLLQEKRAKPIESAALVEHIRKMLDEIQGDLPSTDDQSYLIVQRDAE